MPKTKVKLAILIIFALVLIGGVVWLRGDLSGNQYLWHMTSGGKWFLPLVIVAALLDSINPCAFTVLFLTIAFLVSIESLRIKILKTGAVYIFGLFVTYFLIGLGIIKALTVFNTPHFMGKLGACLLILFGLINIINEFFPKFPIKLRIPQKAHFTLANYIEKASIPAAFILGILVGLFEFPCTGGPYLMILGLLHDSQTFLHGLAYLLLYNLVFVFPLVVILLVASDRGLLDKVQAWQQKERETAKFLGAAAMVILGLIIFFIS
jgi:cytochrome c biogenesis protein CcdA